MTGYNYSPAVHAEIEGLLYALSMHAGDGWQLVPSHPGNTRVRRLLDEGEQQCPLDALGALLPREQYRDPSIYAPYDAFLRQCETREQLAAARAVLAAADYAKHPLRLRLMQALGMEVPA